MTVKSEFCGVNEMVEIRYVQLEDKEFWYSLDSHLPECKCQYKNVQKVENKNVHFIPLSLQTGCQEMLAFP